MAILNRASGMTEWFPGRNIYATGLLTGVAAGLLSGSWYFGLLCALAMYCYRLPGWYKTLDIGTDEGNPVTEAGIMALRTMYLVIPFVIAGLLNNTWDNALLAGVAASIGCATSYTIAWHTPVRDIYAKDPIIAAELMAGGFIGISFWLLSIVYI